MTHFTLRQIGRGTLLGAVALGGSVAHGQDSILSSQIPNPPIPGEWKKTTYHIPRTETAPKIDGKLDDACWKQALRTTGFYRFRSDDPVKEQTEAWICADKTRLYIAFHCLDSHPELIRAHETQREGDIERDDYVHIAIDSQGTRRSVSEFSVNARGTQRTRIDGGSADNLTWAGDWTAATQRVADGWIAEISIPFALMRYPRGAQNFPLALLRQIPRETNMEVWPYLPRTGDSNPLVYLHDFTGIEPPYYAPRFVFLPYVLGTAGKTTALRSGLDVKYPISTTLTGVATLFPDFETVEQAVTDLSFSYTEKFVPDRRPFFAEGSGYLQDSFLFYSQRIADVDGGLKVVGKQGQTTISALGTTSQSGAGQSAFMTSVNQDMGAFSQLGLAVLGNNVDGLPSNRVAQLNGGYGWMKGGRQVTFYGNTTNSWVADGRTGQNHYMQISTEGKRGQLGGAGLVRGDGA